MSCWTLWGLCVVKPIPWERLEVGLEVPRIFMRPFCISRGANVGVAGEHLDRRRQERPDETSYLELKSQHRIFGMKPL